jgi:hypothetical protein
MKLWHIIEILVMQFADQPIQRRLQLCYVKQYAVFMQLRPAHNCFQAVRMSMQPGRQAKVADEPVGGLELRNNTNFVHIFLKNKEQRRTKNKEERTENQS